MLLATDARAVELNLPAGNVDVGSVAVRRASDIDDVDAFASVLTSAARGAPWACRQLYDTTAGRVCGYLRAQRAHEPDDLTSEVFLRVFDRLAQFTGDETQFRSWVFTIAHHLLIDDTRRRNCRPSTTGLTARFESSLAGDVEHEAMTNLGTQWADQLLATLPPDQRAVVALRVTADLPLTEVARILGKRTGAVKALQHRALANLRRRCQEGAT